MVAVALEVEQILLAAGSDAPAQAAGALVPVGLGVVLQVALLGHIGGHLGRGHDDEPHTAFAHLLEDFGPLREHLLDEVRGLLQPLVRHLRGTEDWKPFEIDMLLVEGIEFHPVAKCLRHLGDRQQERTRRGRDRQQLARGGRERHRERDETNQHRPPEVARHGRLQERVRMPRLYPEEV